MTTPTSGHDGALNFPRCKTCIHWEPAPAHSFAAGLRLGKCCSSYLGEEDPWLTEDGGKQVLMYEYAEGGSIFTGPEFGCVHHLPREES